MKLGFLLFEYFPYGGLQRDALRTAAVCAARGHDVTLLTRTWTGERPAGLAVKEYGRRGWTNVRRNENWISALNEDLPGRGFDGLIGFNKLPGLDVCFGSDPCYAARLARLKPFWRPWLPRSRHYRALESSVFARGLTTQILLLTRHEIPFYQQFYGTESERFHILPPGITRRTHTEKDRLKARADIRRERGWPAEEPLLLFVGSGFRVKGLDRAIAALAAMPPARRNRIRLAVIGGRDRPGRFARLARQAGLADRVHFLGGRDDVPDWMLAADLLLHPAHSESAGMVLLEAMTCGLPVLTTDTCGYAFHIEKAGAGRVLASPFVQKECNRELAAMLESPLQPEWRSAGWNYAAREDLYSCHERAADIIEKVATEKRAKGSR
jgi:UDP-glucose:(heptosyl)LPS alpha-1,3-glucosyltransferase